MNALLQWLAPVLSSVLSALVIYSGQRALEAKFRAAERQREQADRETEEERRKREEWREKVNEQLEELKKSVGQSRDALQTTMRQTLIHAYEKYVSRGWLTSEELSSWLDMHDKYAAMGYNGLIDSYKARIVTLDIRPLSELEKYAKEH